MKMIDFTLICEESCMLYLDIFVLFCLWWIIKMKIKKEW